MNSRNSLLAFVAGILAIPLALSLPATAQDEATAQDVVTAANDDDLPTLVNKGLEAMKQNKWELALALNTLAVEKFGSNQPFVMYGAKFGRIHYWKGLCEMKLKKWPEAQASFEACYRDFPNPEDGPRGNPLNKLALLKWGEAAMGAEDWELAIKQFQKFLAERDKELDKYPQGPFHIGMAICHYRLGRIPEGSEHLEIAIKNKNTFPTPDSGIVAGFQELVLACIAKRNEQAALDFIAKNRGEIIIEPCLMQQYSRVLMKIAGDAVAADMDRLAFSLYQFIPTTESAIDDARARLKKLGPLPSLTDGGNTFARKKLEADIEALDARRRGKNSAEMVRLAATAYLHEKNHNVRGAYSAYLQLESFYPTADKREDNLYNLVRTCSIVGRVADTKEYAETFLKKYPDSKHVPAVRRLMLSALFYDGKYAACIEIAGPLIENKKLEAGSPEHDICLHVLGGSYFYTGQHEKAQPLLDQHVEQYPKSPFAVSAAYFRASNVSRMQNWGKAATLLDEFLKANPDSSNNVYTPFALYDRANCDYSEEKYEPALERIAVIIKDFPKSNVLDQAYLLRGNIEQSLENDDRAEQAYLSALQTAEERGSKGVAAEALFSLVGLLGQPADNPRIKDAVPYAERFWKDYAEGSSFRARFAMTQFAAMDAVGRAEDGLARLREVIVEVAGNPEAAGLEPLINFYTDSYLTKHTPKELKEHYYNFPGIRFDDRAARALLRVALIGVFEGVAKKSQDEAEKRAGTAMIKVLFRQLKTDFALKDLSNFILVKVGDYLRTNTATPREALPYYDEALSRENNTHRFRALLGRAEVYGDSGSPADIAKALGDFETVYKESEEKADKELALYQIVKLLIAKKEYAKAAEQALIYLDREKTGYSKYSAEVGLLLAKTFEQRKMTEDAIAMYIKVWSAHMGNIDISAQAMKSWMQLLWDRNKPAAGPAVPSDRQGAYEGGARYIENTSRIKDKMTADELQLWQEVENLVKTYEADPKIKSMAKIKAEKEANQRIRFR